MRYFHMERCYPAIEPMAGLMLVAFGVGGTAIGWREVAAREVLADEHSPEISEAEFFALLRALKIAPPLFLQADPRQ